MNKQILCDLSNGKVEAVTVPVPSCKPGHLLIKTNCTMISTGTERSLLNFGQSGFIEKARQQPDKVKQVIQKARTDGLISTFDAVRSKLQQPVAMGYSNVGIVVEVGKGVEGYTVGDRVVSNGPHAGFVCVPKMLCAPVPDKVEDQEAVFSVLGAISLHGFRLSGAHIGDAVAVVGLGLIGLIVMKIAKASGCRVVGFDVDSDKVRFARSLGFDAEENGSNSSIETILSRYTAGHGFDQVLVAAASKKSTPMEFGASLCRKKAALVQVGVTKVSIPRDVLFEKELSLQVSCSYGPGRYDKSYESAGIDYPIAYVRWTEQRNFCAILELLKTKKICFQDLIGSRYDITDANLAYKDMLDNGHALATIIEYNKVDDTPPVRSIIIGETKPKKSLTKRSGQVVLNAIGAGNYAGRILLPQFAKAGAELNIVASEGGVSGSYVGRKLGFQISTTETEKVFSDEKSNAVVVATQHYSHADFVVQALQAGKSVFVEKPLALQEADLDRIEAAYTAASRVDVPPIVMVGFNRRFSSLLQALKKTTAAVGQPMSIIYSCNVGYLPADNWLHDTLLGGGRIVGEACHFIDAAKYLAGASIVSVQAKGMTHCEPNFYDTATITIGFDNGSIATVNYFANGNKSYPKERIEVFQNGKVHLLENYRKLKSFGGVGLNTWLLKQDKGQEQCCAAFVKAVKEQQLSPIPFDDLMQVSRASLKAKALIENA
ncbi:bi-domain-containing oxidoreductase [Kordiimonas sp.]|uniref:bi-domain-containing oxidoreductase n=1 Tax=Kordiimonas sp. TaxID=1970157 RepID=UPI003B51DF76